MQILAKLLNDYELFQGLSEAPRDRSNEPAVRQVERFLFRACSLISHLDTMKSAEASSVFLASQYYKQIKWPQNRRISFSSESVFRAYAQIAPALSALVDLQNQLLPICRLLLDIRCSLASSLSKEMKRDLRAKGFPAELVGSVEDYWEKSGKYIRDLRDVSEHFMDLSGDAIIEWTEGPGKLLVFLPDNPETKSPSKFTYVNETDAFEALANSAHELNEIINISAKIGGYNKKPFTQSFAFGRNGVLSGQSERTVSLIVSVKSKETDSNGVSRIVLDAIEFGQKAADENQNAEMWARQPKTDTEEGLA